MPAPNGYHPLSMGEVQVCVCVCVCQSVGCRGLRWHAYPWVVWTIKRWCAGRLGCMHGWRGARNTLLPKVRVGVCRGFLGTEGHQFTQPPISSYREWQVYFEKPPPSSPIHPVLFLFGVPDCFLFFFFLVRLYHWTFIDRNQIVVIWAKRRLFRRLHRGVVPRNETGSPTTAEPVLSSRNLPSFNIANI